MSGWREQHAAVLEHEIGEWDKLLAELDNGETLAVTRRSAKLASEIRSLASAVRSEVSAMRTEITELRRKPAEQVLPISLTTRHRRPPQVFECGPDDVDESGGLA